MKLKNYNTYFFFAVLIGVSALSYLVIEPFFVPFLIAVILAHLFNPVYRLFIKAFRSKGASSILACLLILLIIIAPIVLVSFLVAGEVQSMIERFSQKSDSVGDVIPRLADSLSRIPLIGDFDWKNIVTEESVTSFIKGLSQNLLAVLQSTYKGVAHLVFTTFIMFFSLFYLFIDGRRLLEKMMKLSPIKDKYETVLIDKFNSITRATIKGTLLIAMIQGLLGSVLFYFSGVSSPALFGVLMTISSVIPSVGAGLVWFPVGVIMMLLGHVTEGIAILLIGGLVISMIDNFIRPKLVGSDTQMHPLVILFSTLGGIALFGFSGFIVGPIILSLFVALWDIYALEFKTQLREFNE